MSAGLNMSKMVGPLPLGAWVAAVGGGLGLMMYTRRQSTPVAATSADVTGAGTIDPTSGLWAASGSGGGTGSAATSTAPTTNDDWGTAAINALIGRGYDPAVADSAIRKFLGGEALSLQEYKLVTIALTLVGATPLVLPPPSYAAPKTPPLPGTTPVVTPKPLPKPKPAPKPTAAKYYVVLPGDNLSRIASKYHTTWQALYNLNRGTIHNPNLIYPGQRIRVS